jgi:hypothetical protein
VYFYELHEGDAEVFSDVLLGRDEEMEPEEFFDLVQSIRRRIQEDFAEDTLIESIAEELERDHGFVFISDDRLSAAVNVSKDDDDNFLADLEAGLEVDDEFRTTYADLDLDRGSRLN